MGSLTDIEIRHVHNIWKWGEKMVDVQVPVDEKKCLMLFVQFSRILQSIEDYRKDVLTNFPSYTNKTNIKSDLMTLIRQSTPKSYDSSGELHLSFLFKVAGLMDKLYLSDVAYFIDAMKPFVEMSMREVNRIELHTQILSHYDHFAVLELLINKFGSNADLGWMYCAYMMVLEKSNGNLNKKSVFFACSRFK